MDTNLAIRTHEQLSAAGVLHPTGISAPLTLEEAKLLVPYVATVTSATRWWRADIANQLGPEYYEAIAAEFGCSPATVQQDVATARSWPFEFRVDGATFAHHRILNRYVEQMGYEMLRTCLEDVASATPKPTPETMLSQFLNTVSSYRKYQYVPRFESFATWLKDVTGLEVEASNSVVVIATNTGAWRGVAALAGGRPVIDWRFEHEGE